MKLTITLFFVFIACCAWGQKFTGMLKGEITRMPLVNAKVTAGKNAVLSNYLGVFTINITRTVDSVRITCAGYQPYAFKPTYTSSADTVVMYIDPIGYTLREVSIKGNRNLKADSLRLRKEFSTVFNYKGTKLGDIFYKRPPPSKLIPYDYITAPNNATAIVGVDLLSVASLLSKKKDKTTHLQNILLKEEALTYTDQTFSRQKVTEITNLKGDSLQLFMDKYRPGLSQLKSMSDYELLAYIKKSYAAFSISKKQPAAR